MQCIPQLRSPAKEWEGTETLLWTSSMQLLALPGSYLRTGFELLLPRSETHSSELH